MFVLLLAVTWIAFVALGDWPLLNSVVRVDLGWVRWWELILALIAYRVIRKWTAKREARFLGQVTEDPNRRIS